MGLDLSATATRLLGKLASDADGFIALKRSVGSSVSPQGVYTPGTEEIIPLVSAAISTDAFTADGDRVVAGDVVVIADNKHPPMIDDRLIVGDNEYTIISDPPKNHAGIVQVYVIHGRI